jgi:hypothetical protein
MEERKMKINAKKLKIFLDKITLRGEINDCILQFIDEGLKVVVRDPSNIIMSSGILRKENFKEYEITNIPIKNNKLLLNILNEFSEDVNIKVNNNTLNLSSENFDASLVIPSAEFVECNISTLPSLNFDDGFNIESSLLNSLKKSSDILKSTEFNIVVNNNVLYLIVGEDNFDKLENRKSVIYKNVRVKFCEKLNNIIDVTSDTLNIACADDYPMQIKEENSDYIIKWIIAPMSDTE